MQQQRQKKDKEEEEEFEIVQNTFLRLVWKQGSKIRRLDIGEAISRFMISSQKQKIGQG